LRYEAKAGDMYSFGTYFQTAHGHKFSTTKQKIANNFLQCEIKNQSIIYYNF
jgi:hypothetical protein